MNSKTLFSVIMASIIFLFSPLAHPYGNTGAPEKYLEKSQVDAQGVDSEEAAGDEESEEAEGEDMDEEYYEADDEGEESEEAEDEMEQEEDSDETEIDDEQAE